MTTTSLPNWWNLDLADSYVVDRAYGRVEFLTREDALVQMLSKQSVILLVATTFSPKGLVNPEDGRLSITKRDEVLPAVQHAVALSSLTGLVNNAFVEHFAGIVADAIFPEDATTAPGVATV